MINDEILREYDIRGIYGSSLKKNDIVSIADSISSIIIDNKIPEIIIGHDGRDSSLEIKNLLVSSINNNGVNVIDISLVPTPLCYYATNKIKSRTLEKKNVAFSKYLNFKSMDNC